MKKPYKIPCAWEVVAMAEVEAESLNEAISKVEDEGFPLPTDHYYVDDTFEIDKDWLENLYEEEYEKTN